MTEEDRIGLLNEIDILMQVDHPNIVKLIDVYEDSQTFSLVLELMTGGEVSWNLNTLVTHISCSRPS
jgi:serine/threonine protein kinase